MLLALVALTMRVVQLDRVPPGIHDDEVINAQLADRLRTSGGWRIFYPVGEGREGLYYPLLVLGRFLTARVPYWYRLPSVACSLATLLLVHRLVRRRFGCWAAVVALGEMAVTLWPVHLGRVALRAVTFPLVAAGMALALWRALERRGLDRQAILWYGTAGFLLGLSQYSYLAARVLPLAIVLFAAYLACFHSDRLRLHWQGWMLMMGIAVLVALPLGIYLSTHWEEQQRLTRLDEPLRALWNGDLRPISASTLAALGMFIWRGDPQSHYNLPGRAVFDPANGLLFLAGIALACRKWRHPAHAFTLIWLLVTLLPTMLSQPAPHFVRASGALVVAFAFPGIAAEECVNRLSVKIRPAVIAVLMILFIAGLTSTTHAYFLRWPNLIEVRAFHHAGLAEVARYLDTVPDASPVAACTPFLNESHYFWRTDRQALPYLLNRTDIPFGWYNCQEAQLFPRGGDSRVRYLLAHELDFAPFVPADWRKSAQIVATFRDDRLIRATGTEALQAWLKEFERPEMVAPTWNNAMRLEGYRMVSRSFHPGEPAEVLTAWRVITSTTPPYDMAVFVHLLSDRGELVAQGDAFGALSDTLRAGDIFVQKHEILLPPALRPGRYRLATGLYIRGGGRLSLDNNLGDTLHLTEIEVR